jgi:hypothetical protein
VAEKPESARPRRLISKFYRTKNGREPVKEFVIAQESALRLAITRQIELFNALDEEHPHLAFPYSSSELRGLDGTTFKRG